MTGMDWLKRSTLLRASAWSGVAAALAMMALPADALAQNRGDWRGGNRGSEASRTAPPAGGGGWQGRTRGGEQWSGQRGGQRSGGENRGSWGGGRTTAQPMPPQSIPQPSAPQSNRIRLRTPDQSAPATAGTPWRTGETHVVTSRRPPQTTPVTPPATDGQRYRGSGQDASRGGWSGQDRNRNDRNRNDRGGNGDGQWNGGNRGGDGTAATGEWRGRNNGYRDPARNTGYRDNNREEWRGRDGSGRDGSGRDGVRNGQRDDSWRNQRDESQAYRNGRHDSNRNDRWRDNRGWSDSNRYSDSRRWDHDWRGDNRYNWRDYRSRNRNVYRAGRYYAPYSSYYYRPLSIGFFLQSGFYSNRYWIDDPYSYRLPPAYGPYRWVRYYDDALLVDIYSGEVVDVIRDFFW